MPNQRNFFTGGLAIALRQWPALIWTYVFNLGLAVLFAMPLHSQLDAITSHSLASQRLTNGFDLTVLVDVITKGSEGPGLATGTSNYGLLLYFALYFLLVPGTLFCYQTGTPARFATLFTSGMAHFWRFVRITLVTALGFAIILGPLFFLQNRWTDHVDKTIVGRDAFLHNLVGIVVIALVACALRLYFDLVEVYTVQLGLQTLPNGKTDRRIRRTFGPAWRTFRHHFFSAWLSFVLLTVLGSLALYVTAVPAFHTLAQPHAWPIFVLTQIGLFVLLLTRFWQRGAETILSQRHPIPEPIVLVEIIEAPEAILVVETTTTDPLPTSEDLA